jgi:hypothetical protein
MDQTVREIAIQCPTISRYRVLGVIARLSIQKFRPNGHGCKPQDIQPNRSSQPLKIHEQEG